MVGQDSGAWERFFKRYYQFIIGICGRRRLEQSDAEDVAQEVLLRLAQRLE
jgi:DNA-directed RNA polymerase specialized sigma24 family protein